MKVTKKKISMILLALSFIVFLSACSKSSKEEFIEQFKQISKKSQDSNTIAFDMKINALETSQQEGANGYAMLVMNQLKETKVSGEVQTDQKNKTFLANLEIETFGQKIPINLVGDEKKQYLSSDFFISMISIADSFGMDIPVKESDLLSFKGRYLDLGETAKELSPQTTTSKDANKNAQAYAKAYQKEAEKYLGELDKKDFVKEGDWLSYTFKKGDILALLNLSQKVAESSKQFSEFRSEKTGEEELRQFEKFDLNVSVNSKTNEVKGIFSLKFKESSLSTLKFTVGTQFKNKKTAIKLPTKKDILPQEEIANILSQGLYQGYLDDFEEEDYLEDELDELLDELDFSTDGI